MSDTRHYCRNPRCRSKLAEPVENPRSAFCARGCHTQFYRTRCMACEQPMERKTENQRLCGRRKCKAEYEALERHEMLGKHWGGANGKADARNPYKLGIKTPVRGDRLWRQVAGPALTAKELHLATVGEFKQPPPPKLSRDNTASFGRATPPLNLIGGYRFPGAKAVEVFDRDGLSRAKSSPEEATP